MREGQRDGGAGTAMAIGEVLDALPSGVVAIDGAGDIVAYNGAAERLLGVPRNAALGRNLLSIVPNAGLVNVLRTGEPEVGRPQAIGSRTVVANRFPIVRDGVLVGAVSVFQDVTEMDKISRDLDSTKILVRTLEEVLAGSGEWMLVVDANGIITVISEGYAEFNRTTVAEAGAI